MAIKDWPEGERPREKLLQRGPAALSDAELLAIFLRTGTQGKDAVQLARDLLQHFDGLRPLLCAEQRQFCEMAGLGPAKYAQLQAVLEMGRRHLYQQRLAGDPLTDPAQARDYLHSRLRDYAHEVFACLFLDTRHRVLRFEELFRGTLNGASVHPREVVKRALSLNAAALIFAHNHPSGVAEPSAADRHLTEQLQKALQLVEVKVLDHFVIGDGEWVSFAERGWL